MNGTIIQEPPPFLSKDQIAILKKTMLAGFPPEEQDLFLARCERARLDPFSGQIHATKRKQKVWKDGKPEYIEKLVTVVGIYGMIARAVRTGNYEGTEITWCGPGGKWQPEWLEEENPTAAKAVVFIRNRKPEVAIARWFSFAQEVKNQDTKQYELTQHWYKMPDFMLSKCARAAALRAAFPDELADFYIREELHAAPELEIVGGEEEKIADNQAREKAVVIPKAKAVEMHGERPTPAEASEPAFPEDLSRRGSLGEKIARDYPTQDKPEPDLQAGAAVTEDDLNMDPVAPAGGPQPPAEEPAWKTHVLQIDHKRFLGKVLGELNEADRHTLETIWLPKVEAGWEKANAAQKADYPMVQACVAYYKVAKPWQ